MPAMAVLGLGTLVSHGFGLSLVPAMLPRISEDFGVGYGVLGTVTAIGLVAYTVGALAAGRVVDRVPSRELLLGSFIVCGLGLLAAGAATSPASLTAAAVVLGIAAPMSWAVSLHVAGVAVVQHARSVVMAGSASGAALGVLVNGVLVETSSGLHSWRVSFVIAALSALVPTVLGLVVFRAAVPRPDATPGTVAGAGYRTIVASRMGRLIVGSAVVAGAAGWPFTVFLTATALDEMGVSSLRAAALWWLIGALGTVAGPVFGRLGDRASPLLALTGGAIAMAAGLVVLAASWTYAGLVIASVGLSLLYYPMWGLVGALANRHFETAVAVRAISLGLIGAAALGSTANAISGAWIDRTGSFRAPIAVIAAVMVAVGVWHLVEVRRGDPQHAEPSAAYDHG